MAKFAIIPDIVKHLEDIKSLRRDIHAHPELSFNEQRTSELVAKTLTDWGVPIHRGLGKTGVVGIIQAGDSQQAIGLRADMDALPIQERNQFAHASIHPGKMHACGHDGHVAMLLAAARYLVQQGNFSGTIYLLFQPAEEIGGGAQVMLDDGLLSLFPMQSVYGMHNWPGMPAGCFAVSPGPVMASSNTFEIVVRGKGCHAALPHLGLDPVPIAAQIILAVQTILTRNAHPNDNGLISVTRLQAGDAYNVIADECLLAGTVRTFSQELLDLIEQRLNDIVTYTCKAFNADGEVRFNRDYPPTVNDPGAVAIARNVMLALVGEDYVLNQQPTMGAEDFAFFLQALPGCYAFIGNGLGDHRQLGHGEGPCTLHNPNYDFNDDIIALGASYWVKLAEACLPV